jgi:DNA-binding response OmpR family regulator
MEHKQAVLVIDDSLPFRRIAESALSNEGFDVITANDEASGLEAARMALPSLVLVDLVPNMDSHQFCKNIRLDSTLNDIPIVFLSSGNETDGQDYDEKFDNVQYIQKTSGIEAITKTLRETLAGSEITAESYSIEGVNEESPVNTDPAKEAVSHMPDMINSQPIEVPMPEVTLREPVTDGNEQEREHQDSHSSEEAGSYGSMELNSVFSDMSFIDVTSSEAGHQDISSEDIPSSDTQEKEISECETVAEQQPSSAVVNFATDTVGTETVPEAAAPESMADPVEALQKETPPADVLSDTATADTDSAEVPTQKAPSSESVVVNTEETVESPVKESVLVVDDSPTVRRLAELVLSQEGYTVYTAEDGDVGLEIVRKEKPSIILVDFIMPKMNGFQFCKSIKSEPAFSSIPIVLVTSKGEEVGQGFDEKFGIAQYLKKPFETETLAKTVRAVLAERDEAPKVPTEDIPAEAAAEAAAPDIETDLPEPLQADTSPETDISPADDLSEGNGAVETVYTEPYIMETSSSEFTLVNTADSDMTAVKESVLVVDDSPTVRKLAELVLSQEGYAVLTAQDGDVGLEIARREMPSIILVDFIMPKMNGFQFCKSIRSDPVLSSIPIVLITSKGEEVGQGFDDQFSIAQYLKKPFETVTLTTTVKEILAERDEAPKVLDEDIPAEAAAEAAAPHIETELPELLQADTSSETDISPAETAAADVRIQGEQFPDTVSPDTSPADVQKTEATAPHIETELPELLQADTSPETDISPVETAAADVRIQGEQFPDTVSPETSPADVQKTESCSSADTHAEPVYEELPEHIEKEFRHYSGHELTALLKSTMLQVLKENDLLRSSGHILSGEIKYIPVISTMQFISKAGLSGKLSILTDRFIGEIYLESGQIACAFTNHPGCKSCLEELMLKDGKIGQEALSVLSKAGGNSLTAGNILLERGLISENELSDYYRRLSEDAVQNTRTATSGKFYFEDVPLPLIVQRLKLRIPINEPGDSSI